MISDSFPKERRGLPIVLITGFGDATTHERAARLGATCVLDKPFALEEVPEALRYVGEGRALGKVVVEVNVD